MYCSTPPTTYQLGSARSDAKSCRYAQSPLVSLGPRLTPALAPVPVPVPVPGPAPTSLPGTDCRLLEDPGFLQRLLFNREQVYRDAGGSFAADSAATVNVRRQPLSKYGVTSTRYSRPSGTVCETIPGEDYPILDMPYKEKDTKAKTGSSLSRGTVKESLKTKTLKKEKTALAKAAATPKKRPSSPSVGRTAKSIKTGADTDPISVASSSEGSIVDVLKKGTFPEGKIGGEWSKPALAEQENVSGVATSLEMALEWTRQLRIELSRQQEAERVRKQEQEYKMTQLQLEHNKEIAKLQHLLWLETGKSKTATEELTNLDTRYRDHDSEYDALVREHNTLREIHRSERSTKQAALEALHIAHEQTKRDLKSAHEKNSALARELAALKPVSLISPESSQPLTNTPSLTLATPPPPPPSFASTAEAQKLENIRSTYTRVKKRYDTLHSTCVKLMACTHAWDLACFGEFGRVLKALGRALEEEEVDRRGVGGVSVGGGRVDRGSVRPGG